MKKLLLFLIVLFSVLKIQAQGNEYKYVLHLYGGSKTGSEARIAFMAQLDSIKEVGGLLEWYVGATRYTSGLNDHTLLSNIGTNTHAQIDTHIASTANPHSVIPTQLTGTPWRVYYAGADGVLVELAIGTDGTYFYSNGSTAVPGWAIPPGGGDVSKVGAPVDNQVVIWTGNGTAEGDADFTFDGLNVNLGGNLVLGGTVDGIDIATDVAANTAKLTNVSTDLSVGTVTTATVAITSDGGADDVVIPEATGTTAGALGVTKWDEIVLNNAKVSNVATALTIGTVDATTYGISSDGAADDVVIPEATTTTAGILGAAKWDEIVANTAKVTNVPTALSIGTVNATTYGISSDGATDDVVLPEATTTTAGLLGADKWDEIVANTAKVTNVSTTLVVGTVTATTYGITSDGGADDIVLPEANTTEAGLLGAAKWDEIVANSLKETNTDAQTLGITGNDVTLTDGGTADVSTTTAVTANTAKVTNVSTTLVAGTVNATTYGITSDGGADDIVLPEATTSAAGLLGAAKWNEIVANNAKVTNATHAGDVAGDGTLTIQVDAVDIAMLSATGTADNTTYLRGDNTWDTPAGGGTPDSSYVSMTTDAITELTADNGVDVETVHFENGGMTLATGLAVNEIESVITDDATHIPNSAAIVDYALAQDSAITLQWGAELTATLNATEDTTTITITANGVDDTHIDWGTGAGQVSAVDVPIADAGSIITATDVEAALQENRTAIDLNAPITNAVLVTPNLGTPSAGVMTNVSGTAASLTAGNVTTNANLTGEVTSTGNAAVIVESFLEDGGASEIAVTAGMMNTGTNASATTYWRGDNTWVTPDGGSDASIEIDSMIVEAGDSVAYSFANGATADTVMHYTPENQRTEAVTIIPLLTDIQFIQGFGAGIGLAGDTAFIDASLNGYGEYYQYEDSLEVSQIRTNITSGDTVNYSLVIGTALWTPLDTIATIPADGGETLTTSFDTSTIPEGNYIWIEMDNVTEGRNPIKFRVDLFGYIKRD